MVNDLVGKTEKQYKEIKSLKESWEEQCKVINWTDHQGHCLGAVHQGHPEEGFPQGEEE
jgi:predicted nucleic acid-binding protein